MDTATKEQLTRIAELKFAKIKKEDPQLSGDYRRFMRESYLEWARKTAEERDAEIARLDALLST